MLEAIERILEDGPVDLIVLDSIGNLIEGDQNSNSDVQQFYRLFSEISENALCLFLHHLRKRNEQPRLGRMHIQGAGAFFYRARAVLMLACKQGLQDRYLWMEKENDVAVEYREQALVLQFDKANRRYLTKGDTKPLGEITGIDSKKKAR